ncbi:MAG: hypothetical protein ACLUI3_04850 [Christensenellales bacterium]
MGRRAGDRRAGGSGRMRPAARSPADRHKGTFGHVLSVAGSEAWPGRRRSARGLRCARARGW